MSIEICVLCQDLCTPYYWYGAGKGHLCKDCFEDHINAHDIAVKAKPCVCNLCVQIRREITNESSQRKE